MMNTIILTGLVSVINDLSAEMRKIEAAGTSRSDLMSTLKVLGADMTYFGQAVPAVNAPQRKVPQAPKTTVQKPVVQTPAPIPVAQKPVAQTPAPIPAAREITIYTNGSFIKDGAYGWAYTIYDGKKLIHKENGGGAEPELVKTRNIAGELKAVMKAMKWCRRNLSVNDKIIIAYNCEGVENWVLGTWEAKNDITKSYVKFMSSYKKFITFKKVKAHSGVEGNELADKLAKEAVAAVFASKQPVDPVEEPAPVVEESALDLPSVSQEDPAPIAPATTPVEEPHASSGKKKMTTAKFNSQEVDGKQRFLDNMAAAFGKVMNAKEANDF